MKSIITSIVLYYFILPATAQNPVPYLKKDGKYIYVDSANMQPSKIITGEFEKAFVFNHGVAIAEDGQKKRFFFTETGSVIEICSTYPCLPFFDNGQSLALKDGVIYGIIDKTGKQVTPFKYRDFIEYSEEVFLMKDNFGYYSYVDATGKEISKITGDILSFKEAYLFKNGFARVRTVGIDTEEVFIDKRGNKLPSFVGHKKLSDFSEGLAGVDDYGGKTSSFGYIDETGKVVIPQIYSGGGPFVQGYAVVRSLGDKNPKRIVIDKTGKEICSFPYYKESDYYYGVVAVSFMKKDKTVKGFINMKGKLIGEKVFDHFELPGAGLIAAGNKISGTENLEWQIFDPNLKPISDKIYNEVGKVGSNGMIRVMANSKYGFVNTKGQEIISLKYDKANEFIGGYAFVKLSDSKLFYIDASGREYREQ